MNLFRFSPLWQQRLGFFVLSLLIASGLLVGLLAAVHSSKAADEAARAAAESPALAVPDQQTGSNNDTRLGIGYTSPDTRHTQGVAWGDIDGDGDLDLAVGNGLYWEYLPWLDDDSYNQTDQIYYNEGNGQFRPVDIAGSSYNTRDVAWGDWDGDGDLDLALANGGLWGGQQPNQVFENVQGELRLEIGELESEPLGWQSPGGSLSSSVAWGDWDGDGDLDLAVGNDGYSGFVNQVFENISGTLQLNPEQGLGWLSPDARLTADIAWGDWDGDGDLDLAVGNHGDGDQVFENISGTLQLDPANGIGWESAELWLTQAIAWGDWDNDGDLDLAVGGGSRGNQWGMFILVYENEGGTLQLDPESGAGWQQVIEGGLAAAFKPADLAWGDWDNDGDLDLFVGNNAGGGWGRPNHIYENEGGALHFDPSRGMGWESPLRGTLNSETTGAIAVGDADGDNDLDLAVGNGGIENGGQANHIFLNQAPVIGFHPTPWESAEWRRSTSLAWGDWDSDGDLDLAVGNNGQPNQVYENVDGELRLETGRLGDPETETLGWEAPITATFSTTSVAWGDWNGDGDLDLAIGNDGQANQVYDNEQGELRLSWEAPDPTRTRSLAWGDYDRDGDLDLVVGNANDVVQLYENEGGTLLLDPVNGLGWVSAESMTVESVAWGDWDKDGDLDLAAGATVFENVGGDLLLDPANGLGWREQIAATSVAWGDVDGDGDLDLAVGSWNRNRVYENSGSTLRFAPANGQGWESFDVMRTRHLAWGDADGDGDLDLAVANAANWDFEPDQIYENVGGELSRRPVWETADRSGEGFGSLQKSHAVAWGDVDNDGDLDLAFANYCTENSCDSVDRPLQVYHNVLQGGGSGFPLLTVSDPDLTAAANFYASPQVITSTVISIPYRLADRGSVPVGRVELFYSLDGGDNWAAAQPSAGTQTTNLATNPDGIAHEYGWDTFGSDFFGLSDNVTLRMVAYTAPPAAAVGEDGLYRYRNGVADSFARPRLSAVTFPFRVQSTLVRVVDEAGNPLEGAWVYRLPAGQVVGANLMPDTANPLPTDEQGILPGGGQLQAGDRLIALLPVPANPLTFTDRVSLFYTSASPDEEGLTMTTFEQPGVVELTVSEANPFLLFHLDLALEWDARNDPVFMAELENSIGRASEILFDVTNGQAALGQVRVFQNKEAWPAADVVVLANNSLRPSAAIGGVARRPLSETVLSPLGETRVISNAYGGGQIRMGTVWDPFGEYTADLGEDWWRALAHELAHYLLFLPDNYLGFTEDNILNRANCQGSFMTTTYDPSYSEFLTGAEWIGDCGRTLAERTTGRTDWETIRRFYPMLNEPSADNALEGPGILPLNVTNVYYWPAQETRTALRARNFDVRDENNERIRLPAAQAYLFQTQETADPTDDMLLGLGSPLGGGDRLKVRGAYAGDRLCLFDAAYSGCVNALQSSSVAIRVAPLDEGWRPQITVHPVTSRTMQITVTQSLAAGEPINVQLFPAHYWSIPGFSGLSPTATLTSTGDIHTQTVTLRLPAYDLAVRVWVDDGSGRESIAHFILNPPWETAGPNSVGIGGPNSVGIGGPNSVGIGGPNSVGIGGPNSVGIGGPNSVGIGGPNSVGIGGPNSVGIGGASSFHAPIRSADAQVVIYSKNGFFDDNGVSTLQIVPTIPGLNNHSWLVPVGQAYHVKLKPTITDPRFIAFNYLQRDVPEGYEEALTLYFLPDGSEQWQRLFSTRFVENLVVADLQGTDGIYAVMATIELPTLQPGWNLFIYPLPDSRPAAEALSSLAGYYTAVHQPASLSGPPLDPVASNVAELSFGVYWIFIDGTEPVTPYLAPPLHSP